MKIVEFELFVISWKRRQRGQSGWEIQDIPLLDSLLGFALGFNISAFTVRFWVQEIQKCFSLSASVKIVD